MPPEVEPDVVGDVEVKEEDGAESEDDKVVDITRMTT